ncbi:helix-turn-helix transcriptional regulator [Paramicrobacterium fandaimingii]|uniref:helix-turn-helix transcriptional regulator n=1 Tax=Paramicrobacterium fandaimingii TaxID=2708079 RepID=UPI00141EF792|nr:helix-turn-helix domain-containing protein [Microbacterium fandaimingii]
MTVHENGEDRHSALASPIRREILRVLQETSQPLDAAVIAERFDIHITTARFHLDQLERASLVRREVHHGGQRGRPRIAFLAVPEARDEDAQRQLNDVLADALASDGDAASPRAYDAGDRWARLYDRDVDDAAGGIEEPLMRVFDAIGFAPEMQGGDSDATIALHACPFRDVAAAHPEVVCAAHRGLLDGIVRRLGRETNETTLLPFVESELCLVRLHRPAVSE